MRLSPTSPHAFLGEEQTGTGGVWGCSWRASRDAGSAWH